MKRALSLARRTPRRRQSVGLVPVPALVPVELTVTPSSVELGDRVRLRLNSERQMAQAARFLHHLYATAPC